VAAFVGGGMASGKPTATTALDPELVGVFFGFTTNTRIRAFISR
jgi:hypothetical protein